MNEFQAIEPIENLHMKGSDQEAIEYITAEEEEIACVYFKLLGLPICVL